MERHSLADHISIVVLTHNRARVLLATLERLIALPEQPSILVADNGSTDHTIADVTALFPTVRVVACNDNLGAAGRNRAVACVGTEYVAFCDDDTWWEPGSLARAVRLLDTWQNIGVLSANIVVGKANTPDPACSVMRASPLGCGGLPGPALTGYMAGACVFRTSLFRAVGGYEPRLFIGGEEELVALDILAAGQAIVYSDQLTVHHHPSPARDEALRRRMLARNAAWVAWLRLPWRDGVRATLRALQVFLREGTFRCDGIALIRGFGWTWPRRRIAPPHVLAMRERVRGGSPEPMRRQRPAR